MKVCTGWLLIGFTFRFDMSGPRDKSKVGNCQIFQALGLVERTARDRSWDSGVGGRENCEIPQGTGSRETLIKTEDMHSPNNGCSQISVRQVQAT